MRPGKDDKVRDITCLAQRGWGRRLRREVAAERERIARAIETSICEPAEQCARRFCPDCLRYQQAQQDAALARRGGVL